VGLKEQVQADIKDCMKSANKPKLNVLRMLLSEFQYAQTALDASVKLDDVQALKVAAAYQKRLQKSLADFPEGEKKEQIIFEIAVIDHYLPKKADDQEVGNAVSKLLASTEERNFGALMKQVMVDLGGAADGKIVSRILKEKLATT
jgi:hypothetical protein